MSNRTILRDQIAARCKLAITGNTVLPRSMLRAALARDLADVQQELYELGQAVQEWDGPLKHRWLDLREDEQRLWTAIQATGGVQHG